MPALAALWTFARSPAGKIVALVVVALAVLVFVHYRAKGIGRDEVAAKVNAETLKATTEARKHGEKIEREVENAPDRELIECLRSGRC